MMSDKRVCPLCGSEDIERKKTTETICDTFGGCEEVVLTLDCCTQCYTEGDFTNINDTLIQNAVDVLKLRAVQNILNDFAEHKFNFAGLERSLGLPQRTLAKWKNAKHPPSAAGVTLLKFLRIFPWLVDVAELKFDYDAAQRVHIKNGVEKLISEATFNSSLGSSDIPRNVTFNIKFSSVSPAPVIDLTESHQFRISE